MTKNIQNPVNHNIYCGKCKEFKMTNITKEMLIPYIVGPKNQTDITWVLHCWALNGFPDINIMLNKINQLAYQNTKQNNDTRIS
jgi:hypothetical protein